MDLGDLTPDAQPEPDDVEFVYFGATYRAHPDLSQLDYVDFMDEIGSEGLTVAQAASASKRLARMCIHPDDFGEFWRSAKKQRQTDADVFVICQAIIGAVADRPTGRSSDSSDGPSSTATRSAPGSTSTVAAAAERAIRDLEGRGRPDLAFIVQETAEARAG